MLTGALAISTVAWGLHWVRAQEASSSPESEEEEEASLTAPEVMVPLRGMEEIVSLDLRSTEATDALKYLATKGGLNISVSKSVSGRVNLFLTEVPIRDVFDLILRSNELAYDRQGDVYHIMTEEEYRKLYGRKFSDLREVRTIKLQYAIPQQAFNLLDTLKSEIGRLLVDEDSGTILLMDIPDNLRSMEAALASLEQGRMTRVLDVRYAKAADIQDRLAEHLETNKLGYVKADERTNQLVVKALPERMKELEQLIQALDRKTREVLIDAKIVKIAYSDSRDTGIDWDAVFANLKFHGLDKKGDFRTAKTGTEPSETAAVTRINLKPLFTRLGAKEEDASDVRPGELVFGTVARDGYELFRYLQTVGQTKIISNPRLMVTENQEAKILVGTREAYVTSTTTTGQTTSTTAEDVQFIDVGIQLSVTPSINQEGDVTMKIKPEISSVVRTLKTPSNNQIPIVDTSSAETKVMVADGTTVVLGGLRKNEKKFSDEQIPYLGHVPLLGPLFFKRNDRDDQLTELVVFLTPRIVDGTRLVTGDEPSVGFFGYRDYAPILGRSPRMGDGPPVGDPQASSPQPAR